MTDRGRFTVAHGQLGWVFGGAVRGITGMERSRGRDRAGTHHQITFSFPGPDNSARQGAIRLYERRPVALFEVSFTKAGTTAEAFPVFTMYPRRLHHLAYTGVFGRYSFRRLGTDGPWTFFGDTGETFILSPAANFMNASLSHGSHGALRSGIVAEPSQIPAGFVHRTILAMAPGINQAFEIWGRFLTDLAGKKRPPNDADIGLKYLGYWTDHGARYYYRTAPKTDYPTTLVRVREAFDRAGIKLGYLQLDSWFYRKGREGRWRSNDHFGGGTFLYEAAPELFPKGLPAFRRELKLPLVTHNRWIDARSPYRKSRRISGNVSVDPALWRQWMRYLARAGGRIYEQDWLSRQAAPARTLKDGDRFMDMMAQAADREGLTLQYCMALPRHFLQSTKYDNLTTIRTSGDRLARKHWKSFLFNGRLASALGIWPWADVCKSSETANLLLATLSGSMVGVGDAIDGIDRANLLRAVRPDGVIIKPDVPLAPLDRTYVAQAKDMGAGIVAAARTDHGGLVTSYVLAFGPRHQSVTPTELGYVGSVYAYDYINEVGRYLLADKHLPIGESDEPAYWIVVPVGKSGIGFLGDAGKFVSNGKQRIVRLSDEGTLRARLALAAREDRLRLHGYAGARPIVMTRGAKIKNLRYDTKSGDFQFDLIASPGARPVISIKTARLSARQRGRRL